MQIERQGAPLSEAAIEALLDQGAALESQGELEAALGYYTEATCAQPTLGRAHFFRANVLSALGRFEEAILSYDEALRCKRDSSGAHYNRGNALLRLARYEEARQAYEQALAYQPERQDAQITLGVVLEALGEVALAIKAYERAIALNPDAPEVYVNIGTALLKINEPDRAEAYFKTVLQHLPETSERCGELAELLLAAQREGEAITCYQHGLNLSPNWHAGRHALGEIFLKHHEYAAAKDCFGTIIEKDPEDLPALNNYGVSLRRLGEEHQALEVFTRAVELFPENASVRVNFASLLYKMSRLHEAESQCHEALRFDPALAAAYTLLGQIYRALGKQEAALDTFRRALAFAPQSAEAHNSYGLALVARYDFNAAMDSFNQAIQCDPRYTDAYLNLGVLMKDLGRFEESFAFTRKVIELDPQYWKAYSNLLFTLNYLDEMSVDLLLQEAKIFGDAVKSAATPFRVWHAFPDPHKPLRIGVVSGDLRKHPVGYFLDGILQALTFKTERAIEVFAYSTHMVYEDPMQQKFRTYVSHWRELEGISDAAAARQIHEDQIDILIDLSGHTEHNRLSMFAWRPAPVQVSWLGYFATTGLSEIDYFIADPWTLPPSQERCFTEAVWRLPETRLCFTPPTEAVPVSLLPAFSSGAVTFGCFNNLSKVNDRVVKQWSAILLKVPRSRLFMKFSQFADSGVRESVMKRFEAQGVDGKRLMFEDYSSREAYFRAYHRVDISLDPFPYPGGTTTVESLWMGVPVLTLAGEQFLSRQGVGLLMNAGLGDWVAEDEAAYVEKAVYFSNHLPELALLRARLRHQVLSSPIFDATRFADHFESALREMWSRWCARELGTEREV